MPVSLSNSYKVLSRISLAVSLVLTSVAAQNPIPKPSEPIVVTATVTAAYGFFVRGIEQDAFELFIDKQPAKILYARQENVPLSVGIVFDASGSMGAPGFTKFTEPMGPALLRGLKDFIERSNPANEYFVLAFNKTPQLVVDWSSDAKAIVNALGSVRQEGKTALYDACYLAIDKVQRGKNPKRVLLVITAGPDFVSHYSLKEVREALRQSNVLLYTVSVSNLQGGGLLEYESKGILNDLTALSGGSSYPEGNGGYLRTKEYPWVFELLATQFQNQYTIAVEPAAVGTEADKWHQLKLKVTPPNKKLKLTVRTREGFYLYQR